ncbi:MAG TPA: hypothetical protein VES59_02270 [Bacteroidota bacterium]|nr:hypothetical protein [Bacteroidota bacterium]
MTGKTNQDQSEKDEEYPGGDFLGEIPSGYDQYAACKTDKCCKKEPYPRWQRVLGITNILIALATVGLAIFSGVQTHITKIGIDSSNAYSRRLLDSSIALNNRAMMYTKASTDSQYKVTKIELRARVYFDTVFSTLLIGKPIQLLVDFVNFGKTPAIDVKITDTYKVGTNVYPNEWQKAINHKPTREPPIAPGQRYKMLMRRDEPLTQDESRVIFTPSNLHLFWYGRLTYKDAFQDCWKTDFCLFYDQILEHWYADTIWTNAN